MSPPTRLQAYVTSRLLAALVVAVPVALWAFAFAANWTTRVPLYAAAFGWLIVTCVQASADLAYDGMVGIGDGFVALLGLATAAIATAMAALTPLQANRGRLATDGRSTSTPNEATT